MFYLCEGYQDTTRKKGNSGNVMLTFQCCWCLLWHESLQLGLLIPKLFRRRPISSSMKVKTPPKMKTGYSSTALLILLCTSCLAIIATLFCRDRLHWIFAPPSSTNSLYRSLLLNFRTFPVWILGCHGFPCLRKLHRTSSVSLSQN